MSADCGWTRASASSPDEEYRAAPQDGFTLIEMVVTVGLAVVVMVSLAGLLGGGLKAAAVQKTRTRANEIATQGIEDLQRFDYDHLGLCEAPSGTAPQGLSDTVFLANCTNPVYEQPCPVVTGTVPASTYTCTVLNISYSVRRYVAWADSSHAVKRLGVFVDWKDAVGRHEVAQQSSLRSPDVGSVVGLSPPSFSTVTVLVNGSAPGPTNPVKLVNGVNQTPITFQTSTGGLPDSVFVSFDTLVNDYTSVSTLALTTPDQSATWSATLPAGSDQFTFGAGTQYMTFVATRSADGKVNARPSSSVVTFVSCDPGPTNCGPAPSAPAFNSVTVTPTSPHIDSSGAQCGNITVSASTTNTTLSDTVTVSFETLTGPYTVQLNSADGTSWSAVLAPGAGYRFASGTSYFYLTAAQPYAPSNSPPEYGSTAAVQSPAVSFGGACP